MYYYSFNAFTDVVRQTFGCVRDPDALLRGYLRLTVADDRPGFLRFSRSLWATRKGLSDGPPLHG